MINYKIDGTISTYYNIMLERGKKYINKKSNGGEKEFHRNINIKIK